MWSCSFVWLQFCANIWSWFWKFLYEITLEFWTNGQTSHYELFIQEFTKIAHHFFLLFSLNTVKIVYYQYIQQLWLIFFFLIFCSFLSHESIYINCSMSNAIQLIDIWMFPIDQIHFAIGFRNILFHFILLFFNTHYQSHESFYTNCHSEA